MTHEELVQLKGGAVVSELGARNSAAWWTLFVSIR